MDSTERAFWSKRQRGNGAAKKTERPASATVSKRISVIESKLASATVSQSTSAIMSKLISATVSQSTSATVSQPTKSGAPGQALAAQRRLVAHTCLQCRDEFTGIAIAKYCSNRCRQRAKYLRRNP